MKHPILRSFLVLALMFASSLPAIASEVTGTLSSSGGSTTIPEGQGNTGGPSSNPQSTPPPDDDGTLAGSVSGGGSNGGGNESGVNSTGAVLGESTMADSTSPTTLPQGNSTNRISSSKNASTGLSPAEEPIAPSNLTGRDPVFYETVPIPQAASAFGAFSEFSMASWFWIIALSLLLAAVVAYIYSREREISHPANLRF